MSDSYEDHKKKLAEISNEELIEKVSKEISKLCSTGGNSFVMRVPVTTEDTDVLLTELLNRFRDLTTTIPGTGVALKRTYTITEERNEDNTGVKTSFKNDGFSTIELIGLGTLVAVENTNKLNSMRQQVS